MPKTPEERYEEYYVRIKQAIEEKLNVDIRTVMRVEEVRKYFEQAVVGKTGYFSLEQRRVLEEMWLRDVEKLLPKGITIRLIRYPWGTHLRATGRGLRGWFSVRRIKEMFGL